MRVVLYACRNTLLDQIIQQCRREELDFGVEASQFAELENSGAIVQLCSLQTVNARQKKDRVAHIFAADVVIVDEAHQQSAEMAVSVFSKHKEAGAFMAGFTATPVALSHIYDECHQIVQNSVLRATEPVPAHLPCYVYSAPEFDTRGIKPQRNGEFKSADIDRLWQKDGQQKRVYTPEIFGHILYHYQRINPEHRPAICFAPGVPHSKWLTDQFEAAGLPWVHIDGFDVYREGRIYNSSPRERSQAIKDLRNGSVLGISNRYIFREGVDIPEIFHLILATSIGNMSSYVQCVGRVLRNHSSLDHVVIQDHGGNWYRHGSPSADRDWSTAFDKKPTIMQEIRERALQDGEIALPSPCKECGMLVMAGRKCPCQREAITCPKCGDIREWGRGCHKCGYTPKGDVREIIQRDGSLVVVNGNPIKLKRRMQRPDTERLWKNQYFRAKHSKRMTFAQAEAMFLLDHGYYPPKTLTHMPKCSIDWHARVCDVDRKDLR